MITSKHLFDLEQAYFDRCNRDLYRTQPAEMVANLSRLENEQGSLNSDDLVHFVIAFMRVGLFDRACEIGREYVYTDPIRSMNRHEVESAVRSIASQLECSQTTVANLELPKVISAFDGQPVSQLHLNWYIFAWYDYHSALTVSLVMLSRAVRSSDQRSIGRCLSYVGLSASLSGFYDLGQIISEHGLRITKEKVHTVFRDYWVSEAEAICATSAFYACNHARVLECADRVFNHLVDISIFPFNHIYTLAIVMRSSLDAGDYPRFQSSIERLKLALGEQFDVRYTVQSQYCLALFSILHGRSDEGLRHLTIARSELYKDANRLRSINFVHCLGYEARVYMLLGNLQAAQEKSIEAVTLLPEGAGDGRHALELWLTLWRILIIRLYSREISLGDESVGMWLQKCTTFIMANTSHSTFWRQRIDCYFALYHASQIENRADFLAKIQSLAEIAPMDFSEFLNSAARLSLPHRRHSVDLTELSHNSLSIRYLELIGAWQSQLPNLDRVNETSNATLFETFACVVGQILGTMHFEISSRSITTTEAPIFSERGVSQLRNNGTPYFPLEIAAQAQDSSKFFLFSNFQGRISFERHQLQALWLAREIFESYLRTVTIAQKREEEAHLRSIARTTAMLAHDVRAPFSSLRVILDILPTLSQSSEILDQAKRKVDSKLKHVNAMIEDILDISRPLCLQRETISPTELVYRSVQLALSDFSVEYDHFLSFDIRTALGLRVDVSRMQRILVNLISNAATIPDQISTISIRIHPLQNGTSIEVHNTGSKLPDGDPEQVFESFFTGRRSGTGLGLAIARRLVLAHGGSIRAANDQDGVSFKIFLPEECNAEVVKVDSEFTLLPTRISAVGSLVNHLPRHVISEAKEDSCAVVLVVDDDSIYRQQLIDTATRELGEAQPEFFEASHYVDAVNKLRSNRRFTHLIVDVDLGSRKTGLDIISIANREFPGLRIMIHSNRHLSPEESAVSKLKYDRIAAKPASALELRSFILPPKRIATPRDVKTYSPTPQNC